jgi:hypothetical protein
MRNLLLTLCVVFSTFSLAAGTEEPGAAEGANTGESTVVFIRWSMIGAIHRASLYDVTDRRPEFIGFLPSKARLSYAVSPGQHTFMVVTETADFMQAEVVGGKVYYAIATPRMGVVQDRFSLYPVRTDGSLADARHFTGRSRYHYSTAGKNPAH